ncbi:hypothetical protein ACR784_09995, partial [Sphingobacterium multivorum]|uniref:hypothetical protein n=1 Tax=Sphingobacterium multivorum TaxID=28454 RepID=UPI003DA357A0
GIIKGINALKDSCICINIKAQISNYFLSPPQLLYMILDMAVELEDENKLGLFPFLIFKLTIQKKSNEGEYGN